MAKKKKRRMNKGNPVSVLDVASYMLEKQPKKQPLTAWKLQKLVYYGQAWSLVWDEQPLFKERVLAWANGPVIKELYNQHKGQFQSPSDDKLPKSGTFQITTHCNPEFRAAQMDKE